MSNGRNPASFFKDHKSEQSAPLIPANNQGAQAAVPVAVSDVKLVPYIDEGKIPKIDFTMADPITINMTSEIDIPIKELEAIPAVDYANVQFQPQCKLPNDIRLSIFDYLDSLSYVRLMGTCREERKLANESHIRQCLFSRKDFLKKMNEFEQGLKAVKEGNAAWLNRFADEKQFLNRLEGNINIARVVEDPQHAPAIAQSNDLHQPGPRGFILKR